MDLSESENFLRKIYYAYIREPLMKIKERWLAYFAEFAIDEGPSTTDAESEIYSSMEVIPKKIWRNSGGMREKSEYPLSRFNFIMTALGTTLGLGYLWRTPARVFHSESPGAYLIMYCFLTIFFGYFLYVMELGMAQYSSATAITLFRKIPVTQGLGYSLIVFTYILTLHYSQIMSSAAYLFAASFTFNLPWSYCPSGELPELNITACGGNSGLRYEEVNMKCPKRTITFNITRFCIESKYSSEMRDKCCKDTSHCYLNKYDVCFYWTLPTGYYSHTRIDRSYDNYPDGSRLGPAELKFLLYYGAIWFLAFIFSSVDLKWTRIISMIVTPCVLVCLLLMLPIALTGDGAGEGLEVLFVPKLEAFLDPAMWAAAFNDSLYSLGLSTVTVFFFGSVSRFKSPCHLDSILIVFSVLCTTLISSIVMFSEVGRVSKKAHEPVLPPPYEQNDYVFLNYIMEILSRLPAPWFCTIIYLSLFITAGVITMSGLIISMSVTICDSARIYLKDKHIVNFLLTFSFFLLSFPFMYRNSIQIHRVITVTAIERGSIVVGSVLLLAFHLYGLGLFSEDTAFMLGFYPNRFYRYIYMLAPIALVPLSVVSIIRFVWHPEWDTWLLSIAYGIPCLVFAPAILGAIFAFLEYFIKLNMSGIVRVSPDHGPKLEELKIQREEFRTRRRIF